jgi:phosphoribosyl-ATP pyrophosphohydrolase
MAPKNIIDSLYDVILDRKSAHREGSYTCELFKLGIDGILKKVGEEAVEVIIAAKGQGRQRIVEEICDLQYHLLVLMAHEGITPDDVRREFSNRSGRAATTGNL